MRYFIETFGCQMNKAESAAIEGVLISRGWENALSPEKADFVLVNTCSVRITAENRAWARIRSLAALKKKKDFTLCVTGCMAERLKTDMKSRLPSIDFVIGNFTKESIPSILESIEIGEGTPEIDEKPFFSFAKSHYEKGDFKAFVPIMHGCDNFCTYCIVPYVRGREISRDPSEILSEIEDLAKRGVREITLLGQNVNSYNFPMDDGTALRFPGLLEMVAKAVGKTNGRIRWVRFLTSHPKDLSDEAIRVISENRVFCRHVHLCVQNGSDRMLSAMNRRYTRKSYLELVERLRKAVPDVSLSTDILIGFPGETEEDLEDTLDIMKTVRFEYAFMYHFNLREGTPAAEMPGAIPDAVKKKRLGRVIALQKSVTAQKMKERIGSTAEVLVEAVSKNDSSELLARTERDEMVVFAGKPELIGSFAKVVLSSLKGNTFRADFLESEALL